MKRKTLDVDLWTVTHEAYSRIFLTKKEANVCKRIRRAVIDGPPVRIRKHIAQITLPSDGQARGQSRSTR